MCNQTVGLIAAELERNGIATVSLQFLRFIAEAVRPPRALIVPFAHGFALGEAGNGELQHQVIAAALRLLESAGPPPVLADLSASA